MPKRGLCHVDRSHSVMSTVLLCHVEPVETSHSVIPATLLCHVELVETSLLVIPSLPRDLSTSVEMTVPRGLSSCASRQKRFIADL